MFIKNTNVGIKIPKTLTSIAKAANIENTIEFLKF